MHILIEQTVEKIYFFSKFDMAMAEQALVCGVNEEVDGKEEEKDDLRPTEFTDDDTVEISVWARELTEFKEKFVEACTLNNAIGDLQYQISYRQGNAVIFKAVINGEIVAEDIHLERLVKTLKERYADFSGYTIKSSFNLFIACTEEIHYRPTEEERAKSISRFFSGKENSFEGF